MIRHIRLWGRGAALLVLMLALGCGGSPSDTGGGDTGGDNGGGNGGGELNQVGPWIWANPTPQGDPVQRMRVASGSTVFAITRGGAVLKSIDAGESWEVAYKAMGLQVWPGGGLYGLHFLDDKTGWVVGSSGQVTHTNDGGHTWADRSVNTTRELRDVYFTDANNGFVVGQMGNFFRTADGGASWTPVTHLAGNTDLNAIVFSSPNTGWVGGDDGTILRSDDGGANWTQVTTSWSEEIVVADAMAGDLAVFGTVEGATVAMRSPTAWRFLHRGESALDVQFDDENNGTVLYYENNVSHIAKVVAGTWTENQIYLPQILLSIAVDGNNVAGGGSHGIMAHSSDGGATWREVSQQEVLPDPYRTQLWDVCFGDVNTGVTVGDGGVILYTTDGGVTWDVGVSGTTETLLDVWLHSSGRGFAVGEGNSALRTTDGGATWSPMTVPVTVTRLRGVSMWSEMSAILVGDGTSTQETILITDDGGDTWTNKGSTTIPIFVSLSAWTLGTDVAYVGQRDGIVLKTTNRGDTWQEFDTGTVRGIHHLQFVNDTHGWAAVEAHDMVFTKDGGLNWTRIGPGTLPGYVNQVHFVDENVGIAVGTTGNMFRSDDGGSSWYTLRGGFTTHSHIRAIWMSSATDGVIVGTEAKILYTRSAGLPPQ